MILYQTLHPGAGFGFCRQFVYALYIIYALLFTGLLFIKPLAKAAVQQ
jgi:hypothetical protein